ncbi:MAG: hypothetical protein WD431_15685 [Cyclobacteriaceae bacterium]
MRLILGLIIFCLLGTIVCTYTGQAQDLYDDKHSADFADYLLETRQFSLAISEFERLVFLKPNDKEVKKKLLSTYIKADKSAEGINRVDLLYPLPENIPAEIAPIYAFMLLKEEAFDKAEGFLNSNPNLTTEEKYLFLGTRYALDHHWSEAKFYYDQVPIAQKSIIATYREIVDRSLAQKPKSPALATGLSILVPGAGKVYTKDWKDGIMSFLFVGATAWQAYRGFNRSGVESIRGWIFASVSTGFYIGNIFGSYKSAKNFNRSQNEQRQNEIENIFYSDY